LNTAKARANSPFVMQPVATRRPAIGDDAVLLSITEGSANSMRSVPVVSWWKWWKKM
jgi:hypothetical protein